MLWKIFAEFKVHSLFFLIIKSFSHKDSCQLKQLIHQREENFAFQFNLYCRYNKGSNPVIFLGKLCPLLHKRASGDIAFILLEQSLLMALNPCLFRQSNSRKSGDIAESTYFKYYTQSLCGKCMLYIMIHYVIFTLCCIHTTQLSW